MLTYLSASFAGEAAPFMYALLALLSFGMAVLIERVHFLFLRAPPGLAHVLPMIEQAIPRGAQLPKISGPRSPLEQVVAAGLEWEDPDLAWEAMAGAAVGAEQRIRQRVGYLGTIASLATMIGLFGTVYGLIQSFGGLGDVAAAERAARLSAGSSTAMATTAFGLFVAIPAMAAHAWIEAVARARLAEIEQAASRVTLLLRARQTRARKRGQDGPPGPSGLPAASGLSSLSAREDPLDHDH